MKNDLFIAGNWVRTDERFDAINPFTGKPWTTIAQASVEQVAAAVSAARHAFEHGWKQTTGGERARLLFRLADLIDETADEFSRLESTDNGKVIRETRAQMSLAARQYRFYAGYADKLWGQVIPLDQRDVFDYVCNEPLGVVALVTPWNSPLLLLSNKLAPALAAGNTVVVKPSEHASATTLEFCRLIEKAGFPKGVINVVTGDHRVGKALVGSRNIDRVSFTGSPEVGKDIAATAGRNLVPVTLELGGKSPNIIFEDADFDRAMVGALAGIFAATGQTCIAGSRLLVQASIYPKAVDELKRRAQAIRLGNPLDPATEMGTVANEPQLNRIMEKIAGAMKEGARLVTGGVRASGADLEQGFFVRPTIFSDVDNAMDIAQEEVFGPILSIIPFESEEEAVQIANGTRYGLASGVWTANLSRAMRMTRAINAGTVWVNTYRVSAPQAPFGGTKESGFGRERGEAGLAEFLNKKNVMIDFSNDERDPFVVKS